MDSGTWWDDFTAGATVVVTDTNLLLFGEITRSFTGTSGTGRGYRESITLFLALNLGTTGIETGIVGTRIERAVIVWIDAVSLGTVLLTINVSATAITTGNTSTEILSTSVVWGTGAVVHGDGNRTFT